MFRRNSVKLRVILTALVLSSIAISCTSSASNPNFWGKVKTPKENALYYVSGAEPESIDPQQSTSQPDARIHLALFEGLVEYHPKTMEPIPAIAKRWETNADNTEFTFYLRDNARWSNGDYITAKDFVYSFRRGFAPETAARSANLGYYIKYAQAFNEGGVFVKTQGKDEYVLEKDIANDNGSSSAVKPATETSTENKPVSKEPDKSNDQQKNVVETDFHKFINSPLRVTLAGDEKKRNQAIEKNPKLKAAVQGKEFAPVEAKDIGVEAVDDYTFRITLTQPAPYFIGMLAHQFFRAVPEKAIEKYKDEWTQPENIITCGAFKMAEWRPYDVIRVVRDPMYWDAAIVKLDSIYFYAIEDFTTTFNLYTAGEIDGMQNHSVLSDWIDKIRPMKDWMNMPEAATTYYQINTKKAPMNDKRVRKAFSYSIDREAYVAFKKHIPKPAYGFIPPIFNGYPVLKSEKYDPDLAKKLLAEAGYKDASGKYDPSKFPIDQIEVTYNTAESNRQLAEFLQSQWKQNLGLNITLKNVEFRTFLDMRARLEYKGFARSGWVGDYMDPFTFLGLFYTDGGDNGTGWSDPKYTALLDEANRTPDPQKRYQLLSKAEAILLEEQPIISITFDSTNWMKKPYVKGLYPNPQTLHPWKYVYIERDPAKWDYGVPDMTRQSGE